MGWAKMDDRRAMNSKLRKAGFAARGLDEAAIEQCAADMTDGHIDRDTVAMLAAAHGEKRWQRLVDLLVDVGRWEKNGTGWHIHDYLEYNPSRADVLAERAKKQAAGRAGGIAAAVARASPAATANAVAVPSPVPLNTSLKSHSTHDPPAETGQTETGASRPETNLPLAGQIAAICQGRNRGVVNIEAAAVIAWAEPTVDHTIIEEAIGWFETQPKPPDLPRAIASMIATKAADRSIHLEPFKPPSARRIS